MRIRDQHVFAGLSVLQPQQEGHPVAHTAQMNVAFACGTCKDKVDVSVRYVYVEKVS